MKLLKTTLTKFNFIQIQLPIVVHDFYFYLINKKLNKHVLQVYTCIYFFFLDSMQVHRSMNIRAYWVFDRVIIVFRVSVYYLIDFCHCSWFFHNCYFSVVSGTFFLIFIQILKNNVQLYANIICYRSSPNVFLSLRNISFFKILFDFQVEKTVI